MKTFSLIIISTVVGLVLSEDSPPLAFKDASRDLVESFKNDPPIYCAAVNNDQDIAYLEGNRTIPELSSSDQATPGLAIIQAQAMIRHGARTVARSRYCWNGYTPDWHCENGDISVGWMKNATTKEEEDTYGFMKVFDARPRVNILKDSNCELGQLVVAGHKQHEVNGKILAARYFNDKDKRKYLFDLKTDLENGISLDKKIYFRSSEYQRTRMSGAQLLTSMMKATGSTELPNAKLHVIEKAVDTIYPNEDWCYDLVDASEKAFSSDAYKKNFWARHEKVRKNSEEMFNIVADPEGDGSWPFHPFDCLFTTICMGQSLPNGDLWNRNNLEEILAATTEEFEWQWRDNDARFAKTAFVRLVLDMKAFAIKSFCATDNSETCVGKFFDDTVEAKAHFDHLKNETQIVDNKFVLWSAHDNTVGPFLATFGDEFWKKVSKATFPSHPGWDGYASPFPGYASLLVMEFFTATNDNYIRMVYNGDVITQHINECQGKTLCPVKDFFKALRWATPAFALNPCTMKKPTPDGSGGAIVAATAAALAVSIFNFF